MKYDIYIPTTYNGLLLSDGKTWNHLSYTVRNPVAISELLGLGTFLAAS